jgi:hypothetical protein
MANTLGIPERTLAQISEATNSINVIGGTDGRLSAYQPLICRVTDHDEDDGGSADYADGMAIFVSSRHGEPWRKDFGSLVHEVVQAAADPVATPTSSSVTVLFPNYDYSTFE